MRDGNVGSRNSERSETPSRGNCIMRIAVGICISSRAFGVLYSCSGEICSVGAQITSARENKRHSTTADINNTPDLAGDTRAVSSYVLPCTRYRRYVRYSWPAVELHYHSQSKTFYSLFTKGCYYWLSILVRTF